MPEETIIQATGAPITRTRIAEDLTALGIRPGETLFVHSALSKLGYVSGGPEAVILGLMDGLGPDGTLVMPAFTGHLSDPEYWSAPPVPKAWWPILRETMTPFHPATTPTRMMGAVAETFRSWPGVVRSAHPHDSFCARGPQAQAITAAFAWAGFGDGSPLAALYEQNARVLLLGVGFENCTAFHLGEDRARAAPPVNQGAPITENGVRIWKQFDAPDYDSDDFGLCGAAFETAQPMTQGTVGQAPCRLFSLRAAADFAQKWLPQHRSRA